MTYTKINLYLANGIPEALSNLWYGSDSAVVEIRDAVEDAKNGKDLLNRLQKMKLLRKFTLDRENENRIRFKGTDCWGNVSYLEIIRKRQDRQAQGAGNDQPFARVCLPKNDMKST